MTRIFSPGRVVGGLAAVVAVAGLTVGLAQSSQAGGPTCRGQAATIVGDADRDVIDGTPGRDVIVSLGGNDEIDRERRTRQRHAQRRCRHPMTSDGEQGTDTCINGEHVEECE